VLCRSSCVLDARLVVPDFESVRPDRATCCARGWRHRLGYRSMTLAHGTKPRTAFARGLAMTGSPGSPRAHPRTRPRLRAGHTDYVLNQAAFSYLRSRGLPGPVIARLAEAGETRFIDQAAWQAHPNRLGHRLARQDRFGSHPGPCADCHEGAQWPDSSTSASTRCAGFMRNGWCISWILSRIGIVRLSNASAR
jgi:hypothetical protein